MFFGDAQDQIEHPTSVKNLNKKKATKLVAFKIYKYQGL